MPGGIFGMLRSLTPCSVSCPAIHSCSMGYDCCSMASSPRFPSTPPSKDCAAACSHLRQKHLFPLVRQHKSLLETGVMCVLKWDLPTVLQQFWGKFIPFQKEMQRPTCMTASPELITCTVRLCLLQSLSSEDYFKSIVSNIN